MSVEFKVVDRLWHLEPTTNASATSESPNFPASNAKTDSPTRVWRSGGYYVVTASNGAIPYMRLLDDPVPNLYTIPPGNYTKQEIIDLVSAGMVSINGFNLQISEATGLWTFSGLDSFKFLWATGPSAANSAHELFGFADADTSYGFTQAGTSISIHTRERLVIDLVDTGIDIDTAAVIFHPDGPKLSNSATMRLKANTTNSETNWASAPVDVLLTIDEDIGQAIHFFTSNQNYRYWAIEIVDPTNSNLYVEIGKFLIGKGTDFGRAPKIGFTFNYLDRTKSQENAFGTRYYDIYPNQRQLGFDLELLTNAQLETLSNIFNTVGISRPIAVILDSDELLFNSNRFFIYGRFDSSQEWKHVFTQYFNLSLGVTEVL